MDISKLVAIDKRSQIISAFEKAASFGGDLWQTNAKGRMVFQISQIYIDVKKDRIVIKSNDIEMLDFNLPIYVRLCYRNVISRFEPHEFFLMGDKLVCDYPRSARALEVRNGDRYVLPFDSNISLSLRRIERSARETAQEIELRIIDFSNKGFGILISAANRDFLSRFDHFCIMAVDQRPLSNMIFGSVTYISPKGYYLKRGDVRVGLSLDSPLPQDTFDDLKRRCKKVLSA